MKSCSKCKLLKEFTDFNRRGDGPGYRSQCKNCVNLAHRKGPRKKMSLEEAKNRQRLASKKYNATKERKAKQAFYESNRRALKLKATPKWLSAYQLQHIEIYYQLAQLLTEKFSIQMDVDHIIPLKGKNVSGLHVPWNMQIMCHSENVKKNNRLDYEY